MKEEARELQSCIVKTAAGSELRDNRVQLKLLETVHRDISKPSSCPQLSSPGLPKVPAQSLPPSEQSDANLPLKTRSGRVIKKPS